MRALIWDVDGTVAETESQGHRVAFNLAFASLQLPWRWDVAHYGELLRVAGGRERLRHDLFSRPEAPRDPAELEALVTELHLRKNRYYADLVKEGCVTPRPGVVRLMEACVDAGVAQAIATTTSAVNVDALLASFLGEGWRRHFAAVVCAEDAPAKKPDPQVYRLALERLDVEPGEAFALEDSPLGLAAARAAGVRCGITRSEYFRHDDFEGAAFVRDDLDDPPPITLETLGEPDVSDSTRRT